jgi:hypothetical protein
VTATSEISDNTINTNNAKPAKLRGHPPPPRPDRSLLGQLSRTGYRLMPRIYTARTGLLPVSRSTARSKGFLTRPIIRSSRWALTCSVSRRTHSVSLPSMISPSMASMATDTAAETGRWAGARAGSPRCGRHHRALDLFSISLTFPGPLVADEPVQAPRAPPLARRARSRTWRGSAPPTSSGMSRRRSRLGGSVRTMTL